MGVAFFLGLPLPPLLLPWTAAACMPLLSLLPAAACALLPTSFPVPPFQTTRLQVHTLFPAAKTEEGIKGGVVLLCLAPSQGVAAAAAPPLRLEARYTDRWVCCAVLGVLCCAVLCLPLADGAVASAVGSAWQHWAGGLPASVSQLPLKSLSVCLLLFRLQGRQAVQHAACCGGPG